MQIRSLVLSGLAVCGAAAPAAAQPTLLSRDGAGTAPSVSADAAVVAFTAPGAGIFGFTRADNALQTLAPPPARLATVGGGMVAWLSAGAVLASAPGAQPTTVAADRSAAPDLALDGRFVTFASDAPDLVPFDSNGRRDVFLHNLADGQTTLVSANLGLGGDGPSSRPAVGSAGRLVAFASAAGNLVVDDENERADVFVRDNATSAIERVSVSSFGFEQDRGLPGGGLPVVDISAGGRLVAFESGARNLIDGKRTRGVGVYVRDRTLNTTRLAGPGRDPALSPDGRYVAFTSARRGLVAGTPKGWHTYLHDRRMGVTTIVDVDDAGRARGGSARPARPAVARGARFVAFATRAAGLAGDADRASDVFLRALDAPGAAWVIKPERQRRYGVRARSGGVVTFLCRVDNRPARPCARRGTVPRGAERFRIAAGGPGRLYGPRWLSSRL